MVHVFKGIVQYSDSWEEGATNNIQMLEVKKPRDSICIPISKRLKGDRKRKQKMMIESSNDDIYDTLPCVLGQARSPSKATIKDSHSNVDASLVTSPFRQIGSHVDVLILNSQEPIVEGLGTQ